MVRKLLFIAVITGVNLWTFHIIECNTKRIKMTLSLFNKKIIIIIIIGEFLWCMNNKALWDALL